jgi:hypothetical protein
MLSAANAHLIFGAGTVLMHLSTSGLFGEAFTQTSPSSKNKLLLAIGF